MSKPTPVVGQRIKLIASVDRFPDFIAEAGMTGTIVEVEMMVEEVWTVYVKMDQPLPNCQQWDNQIIWHREVGDLPDVFWAECEVITDSDHVQEVS